MGAEFDPSRRRLIFSGVAATAAFFLGPSVRQAEAVVNISEKIFQKGKIVQEAKEVTVPPLNATFPVYHDGLRASTLKRDILNYLSRGFVPITLDHVVAHFNGDIEIPSSLPTFMVTCDDGYASQYEAVLRATEDVFQETGFFIQVVFFVMTKFNDISLPMKDIPGNTPSYNDGVNKYMPKDQLIEVIEEGHRVEAHTPNHGHLTRLREDARRAEVLDGKLHVQELWKLTGKEKKTSTFAYPYGEYNNQIIESVKEAHYDIAFSTNRTTFHSPADRYNLGRIGR